MTVALLFLAPGLSRGDTLSFTFTEPTVTPEVLTGTLFGTVAGDGNTFVLTGFGSLALNGVSAAMLPTNVESFDTTQGDNVGTQYPTVTLDGTYMDLWANTPGNTSVMWIADGTTSQPIKEVPTPRATASSVPCKPPDAR